MLGIEVDSDYLGVRQFGYLARQSPLFKAHAAIVVTGCLTFARSRRAEPSSVEPFTTKEVVVRASFPEPCATPPGAANLPMGTFTSLLLPVL